MARSTQGYDLPAVGRFTVEQSSTGQTMGEQHAAGWPGFARALRTEVLKGVHAAPRKVTLVAPLSFCALGMMASGTLSGEGEGGAGFATYGRNYWYVLMLQVSVVLMSLSLANLDARQGLRPMLGLPLPPALTWWPSAPTCSSWCSWQPPTRWRQATSTRPWARATWRRSMTHSRRWSARASRSGTGSRRAGRPRRTGAGTWSRSCTSSRCRSPSFRTTPSSSRVTSRRAASPGIGGGRAGNPRRHAPHGREPHPHHWGPARA